ncbi:MAG: biotin--[acetyl-CoA-carboxylase] ligase [Caldithrix sp.]|nr:biotin--[acetyl-CoA-carboxylase] ligase [Caldithrix sp.]
MNIDQIKQKLQTNIFGDKLFYYEEVDSTNARTLQLAREGAPEGTVVLTDFQKKGKGRLNRTWFAPKGENLLVSVLLRPEQEITAVQKITLAMANIVLEVLDKHLKSESKTREAHTISLKWPNDVLIDHKKVAGILSESILKEKHIEALVIGFGINLNTPVKQMPDEIKATTISLIDILGKPVNRERFLCELLLLLEKHYTSLERSNYKNVVKQWKKHCPDIGQKIIITTPGGQETGTFQDINKFGYLVYQTDDGIRKELNAGEIRKA